MTRLPALALLVALLPLRIAGQDPAAPAGGSQGEAAADALRAGLAEHGVHLDVERGLVSLPVRVLVRDELLEYVLVGPRGQLHESLFVTDVAPSVLNTALLALGLEPGQNARWRELGPAAGEDGGSEDPGAPPRFEVSVPEGDGVYLYAGWREGPEVFLHRVEDLVSNLATGRSLQRHRWVFLGSRFAALRPGEPEAFLADVEQNLINLSFFYQGNTLVTAALPECEAQTIWLPNSWLVPPRDSLVELILSRERLATAPPGWEERLPELAPPAAPPPGGPAPGEPEDGR